MIEPPEIELKVNRHRLVDTRIELTGLASSDPEALKRPPVNTSAGRLDETRAARKVRFCPG